MIYLFLMNNYPRFLRLFLLRQRLIPLRSPKMGKGLAYFIIYRYSTDGREGVDLQ